MNRMIGFFGSKTVGFDPSRTPPWGATFVLAAEVALAVAVTVFVTTEAMI
jgi:hypothetical protein